MQKTFTTLRRKILSAVILAAVALAGIFFLVGCSNEDEEYLAQIKREYPIQVTYDFDGGVLNNKGNIVLYVKDGSALPEPRRSEGGVGIPAKTGYSFRGFFRARLDDDGNIVRDEAGNAVTEEKQWDFDKDRVNGESMVLCAKWWDNYKVVMHYGEGYTESTTVPLSRNQDGTPVQLFASALNVRDFTFLSYKLKKDSTDDSDNIKFPYTFDKAVFDASQDGHTAEIWGESLNGIYQVVREARDLSIPSSDTNIYLLNDIDMDGAEYDDQRSSIKIPKTYNGKFIGNGHKISNFSVNMIALDATYNYFGLFRTIGNGAVIMDVTFENVKFSLSMSNTNVTQYNVGMLAGRIEGGATVNNVHIKTSDDADKTSVFEYKLDIGVSEDKLKIAENMLAANIESGAVVAKSTITGVQLNKSAAVYTADKKFLLYVKYTEDGDQKIFDSESIYVFAPLREQSGTYRGVSVKEVRHIEGNDFVLVRDNRNEDTYDITIVDNDGTLSATVVIQGN